VNVAGFGWIYLEKYEEAKYVNGEEICLIVSKVVFIFKYSFQQISIRP
jgi:hypothetical protein